MIKTEKREPRLTSTRVRHPAFSGLQHLLLQTVKGQAQSLLVTEALRGAYEGQSRRRASQLQPVPWKPGICYLLPYSIKLPAKLHRKHAHTFRPFFFETTSHLAISTVDERLLPSVDVVISLCCETHGRRTRRSSALTTPKPQRRGPLGRPAVHF